MAFKGDEDMLPLFPRMMEKALWRVQLSLEYPCKAKPSRVSKERRGSRGTWASSQAHASRRKAWWASV